MFQIRYEGRTFEIKPKVFELSIKANDGDIMRRVADWLGIPEAKLEGYFVERAGGTVIVRRNSAVRAAVS